MIDFDDEANADPRSSAAALAPILFEWFAPASVLDVGCGTGIWLRELQKAGVRRILGVEGATIVEEKLEIPVERLVRHDLTESWDPPERFDLVLCLEVAEHLEEVHAEPLIHLLTRCAPRVLFSAAIPGQPGQHHVHCRWPRYWQDLFNQRGYACRDTLRDAIWDDERIGPWYRQNLFLAEAASDAASEERIRSLVHPEILGIALEEAAQQGAKEALRRAASGSLPAGSYFSLMLRALWSKLRRRTGGQAAAGQQDAAKRP